MKLSYSTKEVLSTIRNASTRISEGGGDYWLDRLGDFESAATMLDIPAATVQAAKDQGLAEAGEDRGGRTPRRRFKNVN